MPEKCATCSCDQPCDALVAEMRINAIVRELRKFVEELDDHV